MWILLERWAMTGKKAPKEPVNQMIKREAMRRPSKAVSPPPEPQLTEDEDMLGSSERGCKQPGWLSGQL
jgi:hypothetical protein